MRSSEKNNGLLSFHDKLRVDRSRDCIESTASSGSSIVMYAFIAEGRV
jgi:hypothetical protein